MIIHFKSKEHEWLSNFYPCEIKLNGITYGSIEHAYMSEKSFDIEWKEFCRDTKEASMVKNKSREIKLREDWNKVKINVMRQCVTQKFSTEPLKSKLMDTKNEYIQEGNWWNDTFWGVDLKATPPVGKNMLGILIMEVRSNLCSDLIL